ncbi:carotenoid oxygenase family protein [Streptomyces sp. HU2014]|uniref:carotenoid oxygenase family protein n=1 Tax=Streptomyces sp. HU2014 TaxID=2939414 RepID=UPI00200ECCF8|nr:carotenoid oxygenase family protein [Streptomyces sp. HU2014]UQI43351.1 carotenoid oxygenase family protein [Streptomyces sp. HU2014]
MSPETSSDLPVLPQRMTIPAGPSPLPKEFPGYQSLDQEVSVDRLPITGRIPEWLTGTLIRNGPAKFDLGDYRLTHWFNGLGMLHSYSFGNGQVSYVNRHLRTKAYDLWMDKGEFHGKQYGLELLDPCQKLFGRHMSAYSPNISDNPSVNLMKVAEKFYAINESPMWMEFDPLKLEAHGEHTFKDQFLGEVSTPHPHFDFHKRAVINYTTKMTDGNAYQVFYIPENEAVQKPLAVVGIDDPCYMHSFAVTENYVILVEFPVVLDTEKFRDPGYPFVACMSWQPERPARFLVVDKREGKVTRTFESEAFFAFHHVNAAEIGNDIVVDIAATHTPYESVLGLPPTEGQFDLDAYGYALRRYTLPMAGSGDTVGWEHLSPRGIEMPTINYRGNNGRPYRYAYGISSSPKSLMAMNRLSKIDIVDGSYKTWYERGCFPSEGVFVQRPGATGEDDGVLLSGVLDAKTGKSFMLVLDARSFEELGRAHVPHHIPNDFHGQFHAGLVR